MQVEDNNGYNNGYNNGDNNGYNNGDNNECGSVENTGIQLHGFKNLVRSDTGFG